MLVTDLETQENRPKNGHSFTPTSVIADVSWGNSREWPHLHWHTHPSHSPRVRPPPLTPDGSLNTQTHTAERFFFFFPCLCPPQPAASSDRKPQFPLLLLWASHSLFLSLFIPLFFAFVFLSRSPLSLSVCFSLPLLISFFSHPLLYPFLVLMVH